MKKWNYCDSHTVHTNWISRQLHSKFDSLVYLTLLEVSNVTGCLPPCTYLEYRVLKKSLASWQVFETNLKYWIPADIQEGDPTGDAEHLPLPAGGDGGVGVHCGVLRWTPGLLVNMVGNPEARITHLNHNSFCPQWRSLVEPLGCSSASLSWTCGTLSRLLQPFFRLFANLWNLFWIDKLTFMNLWDGVEIIALS